MHYGCPHEGSGALITLGVPDEGISAERKEIDVDSGLLQDQNHMGWNKNIG